MTRSVAPLRMTGSGLLTEERKVFDVTSETGAYQGREAAAYFSQTWSFVFGQGFRQLAWLTVG